MSALPATFLPERAELVPVARLHCLLRLHGRWRGGVAPEGSPQLLAVSAERTHRFVSPHAEPLDASDRARGGWQAAFAVPRELAEREDVAFSLAVGGEVTPLPDPLAPAEMIAQRPGEPALRPPPQVRARSRRKRQLGTDLEDPVAATRARAGADLIARLEAQAERIEVACASAQAARAALADARERVRDQR